MGIAASASWYLQNQYRHTSSIHTAVNIKDILKKAWPYGLIILLMSTHYRLDGFILERLLSDGKMQAGIYASAYRLLDAANMAGFLLASFLLPMIAKQVSQKKDIESLVLNVRHLLMTYSLGIAIIGIFAAPWLNQLLYHFASAETVTVLQYCLPAIIGYSLVHIYGTVMTATGHIRDFCLVTAVAVAINIVLNLFFIPNQQGGNDKCAYVPTF